MLTPADYDELARFKSGPIRIEGGAQRLQRLIDHKLIAPAGYKTVCLDGGMVVPVPDTWMLTVDGEDALSEFEDVRRQEDPAAAIIAGELNRMNENVRQKHAEEKSEKEKDRRFQLFNTFLAALLGSAFTLLVEHWAEIVNFFSSLFQP